MSLLRIAVCDDIPECVEELIRLIKAREKEANIDGFTLIQEFFLAIQKGIRYDLVFMDVHWAKNKETGIEFAGWLYERCMDTKLIYVTAQTERYAQQIFLSQSNLCGFLIKPVDRDLLDHFMRKIHHEILEEQKSQIIVRNQGQTLCIALKQIIYMESEGHKVKIHMKDQIVVCYEQLSELAKQMNIHFIQCHKSYIINMREIARIDSHCFVLRDGTEIPISRSQYNKTKEAFFRYISEEV